MRPSIVVTAAIGKWHLGYGTEKHDFTKPLSPGPLDIGFDYHFAVPQNHGDASGVYVRNREVVGLRSDRKVPAGKSAYGRDFMGIDAPQRVDENVMDELTTDAIGWLEKQRDDTPFFLYFAPVAIHFPYTPSEKTKGKSGTGLYGDWIHELDLSVGRILNTLDRMNATEETFVGRTKERPRRSSGIYDASKLPEQRRCRVLIRPTSRNTTSKRKRVDGLRSRL